MVNVIDPRCIFPNCMTLPTYNIEDKLKPQYCFEHKSEEMINVKSKLCEFKDCVTRPNYNYEGTHINRFCSKHKLDGMITTSTLCKFPECKTRPTFNFQDKSRPIYCVRHKEDTMINVLSIRCKTYLCDTVVTKKYCGYCIICYLHLFPDKPQAYNYKTKERAVVEYVLEHFPQFTWITDKRVQDGCSKRRPDLLLDLGYQVIIVEVDENQHINYDCSCENKRIMELSQDNGHRPIIFIRFNPDIYYDSNGIKIKSCWTINGKGICAVNKVNREAWSQRLSTLKNQITYWLQPENKTDKTIEIIQLFYDGFTL